MTTKILLDRSFFTYQPKYILNSQNFKVSLFRYNSGVEGLTLENSQGYITLLPYMGQIIWDVQFKNINLTMKNMFSQPKPVDCIVDSMVVSHFILDYYPTVVHLQKIHTLCMVNFHVQKWIKHGLKLLIIQLL